MYIVDEIIDYLKEEQKENNFAYISCEVLKDFYSEEKLCNKNPNREFTQSKTKIVPQNIDTPDNRKKINTEVSLNFSSMSFEDLTQHVKNCNQCDLSTSRTNTVFGEGSINAELMLIGEGPGKDEDEQGRPFVGKSGQLLTKMLKAMGYDRSEVFIANIVKCRPPLNRNPHPDEADSCLPILLRQIEIIKPKVIILLGAVPLKHLLNKTGITRIHGEWHEFHGIKTLPTFHPAFLLRDSRQKKYAWSDLQKAMKVLGKTHQR
jgi:uracil-DNA glycosylase